MSDAKFRVIDGRVYEVLHDGWGNPYLKPRGDVVEDEQEVGGFA